MTARPIPVAGLVLIFALMCGACGEARTSDASRSDPATTTVKTLPKPPQSIRPKRRSSPKLKACDSNIRVKATTTTCPFASNVFYGYWLNEQEPGVFTDSTGILAYSPAAGHMFYLDCSGSNTISCRSSDGALVIFQAAAVARYTLEDARAYASRAELGDVPEPTPDPVAQEAPSPPVDENGGDCNPNYADACLDQPGDYDCIEGSGNGPNYTGQVSVVGDDPYGLDRDGDRIGCNN